MSTEQLVTEPPVTAASAPASYFPAPRDPEPRRKPTGRRSARTTRLPGLDGLRALAVLAVMLFHLDPTLIPGGFLGVDLFFVISGYLITRLLLTEITQQGALRAMQVLPAKDPTTLPRRGRAHPGRHLRLRLLLA